MILQADMQVSKQYQTHLQAASAAAFILQAACNIIPSR